MTVMESYQQYIKELHVHLFEQQTFEQIVQEFKKGHRRKRFVAIYLIQDKTVFDTYYEKRNELKLEKLFNQLVSALLFNTKQNPLKELFVETLELTPDMITGKVSSYEIRVIEKDLHAFAFYQTKKELKSTD
jgi:hypothetical protein